MMVGPFQGMNPYLERRAWWGQIHSRFVHALADDIGSQLPGYLVDVEQDTLLVAIEPAELVECKHYYLVLRDMKTAHPVTIMEVLSYANKEAGSRKRERFRIKRELVLRSSTHWVEVDFLRAGTREVAELFEDRLTRRDYIVAVSRATSTGRRHEAYPFSIREPIPTVGIPLSSPDSDLQCDLGSAFARVCEAFGAEKRIAYEEEPVPPLLPGDRAWLDQLLRSAGRRR